MNKNNELVLHRDLPLSRAETWAWLTDSEKTALWYGPYQRDGDKLFITMLHEDGQPTVEGRLVAHEREQYFTLRAGTQESDFTYRVDLSDAPGGTRVTLRQDLPGTPDDPWFEAGWNFYLDCLKNAVAGEKAPTFEDYARHLQGG